MLHQRLDDIQESTYEELIEFVRLNRDEDSLGSEADGSIIIKRINRLLVEFGDTLTILERRLDKDNDEEVSQYHHYVSKLSALRARVRLVQLEAHNLTKEVAHNQRIMKYNIIQDTRDPREQLFSNRSTTPQTPELSINQQILSQNKQITSSLQSTRQLLTSSILQSELNIDSLDQQTKDLNNLNEEFMKFSDVLNKSRQIVKFIEKQDRGDKQRIYLSFGFFALCCVRIIWKRILRTPVRIFLWTFFKAFGIVNWFIGSNSKGAEAGVSSILNTAVLMASSAEAESILTAIVESTLTVIEELTLTVTESAVTSASETVAEVASKATLNVLESAAESALTAAESILSESLLTIGEPVVTTIAESTLSAIASSFTTVAEILMDEL